MRKRRGVLERGVGIGGNKLEELLYVPKEEEIDQAFLLSRVMYKAVFGLHFTHQAQKRKGQRAIF